MSRKVYSEHILATKVLMPVGGGGGGCLGKCTLSTLLGGRWVSGCLATKVLMPMGG